MDLKIFHFLGLFLQIWYHRRALLETLGAQEFCKLELAYIQDVLREDAKNYHAWSYRQWILATVDDEDFWKEELEYGTRNESVLGNKEMLLPDA
jgi:Protein prenyltransferase alpha subunit repeat